MDSADVTSTNTWSGIMRLGWVTIHQQRRRKIAALCWHTYDVKHLVQPRTLSPVWVVSHSFRGIQAVFILNTFSTVVQGEKKKFTNLPLGEKVRQETIYSLLKVEIA